MKNYTEIDDLIAEYIKDPLKEEMLIKARKRVKKWIRKVKYQGDNHKENRDG